MGSGERVIDPNLKLELTLKPGTVFLGNGGVEKWLSLAGGYCLTQNTVASKPKLQSDGVYFDGDDWLSVDIPFATRSTWAIEFFYFQDENSSTKTLFHVSNGTLGVFCTVVGNTQILLADNVGGNSFAFSFSHPANTWCHLCFSFNGATYIIFKDGVSLGENATALVSVAATNFRINGNVWGGYLFAGKMADIRIWNVAKYTANFPPPLRTQLGASSPIAPPTPIVITALVNQFDSGD